MFAEASAARVFCPEKKQKKKTFFVVVRARGPMGGGPGTVETASGPSKSNTWNPWGEGGPTLGGQLSTEITGKGAWRSPTQVLIPCPWAGRSPAVVLIPSLRNPVTRRREKKLRKKIHHQNQRDKVGSDVKKNESKKKSSECWS